MNNYWNVTCYLHIQVYDVTSYLTTHPGGAEALLKHAGKDSSEGFHNIAAHQVVTRLVQCVLRRTYIGDLKTDQR